MKIAIQNGRILDPLNEIDKIGDLFIAEGKIVSPIDQPDKIIDATEQWVLPGFIDVHCQTSDQTEMQAALQRGITSLCVFSESLPFSSSSLHLYPILPLLQEGKLADLTAQATEAVAFHIQQPIKDTRLLRHAYEYAATFDLLIVIQAQDPWLSQGGAHEGIISTRLGLAGIPDLAETLAIAQHLLLIEATGVRAHFTCVSSGRGIQQIQAAKLQGLPVTADVAMHALHLTEMDLQHFDPHCHVNPPLRSQRDREQLQEGIQNRHIEAICSQHCPLDLTEKLMPFGETRPGMSTIDLFFSLGLHLVQQKKLSLSRLIASLTCDPARLFHLPGGTLSLGASADICIVDPHRIWQVTDKSLYSKGKNTPFKQWELPGIVTHTLVEGKLLHEVSS